MQLNSIKSGKKKHYISIFPDILIINQRVFIRVQETPDLKGTREQGGEVYKWTRRQGNKYTSLQVSFCASKRIVYYFPLIFCVHFQVIYL